MFESVTKEKQKRMMRVQLGLPIWKTRKKPWALAFFLYNHLGTLKLHCSITFAYNIHFVRILHTY